MADLIVKKKNHSSLQIQCESHVANELYDFFAFETPGYKYMPAYKSGKWDGMTRLFNIRNNELPVGLFDYLKEFVKPRNYSLEIEHDGVYGHPEASNNTSYGELVDFIKSLNTPGFIEEKDYQYNAILQGINSKRAILLSPTGSGKSFIIYVLMRWLLEQTNKKILVVVPRTSLVQQMFDDFKSYSEEDEHFDAESTIHRIYSGAPKHNVKERVFVSTWQSIHKLPSDWFQQFGAVFGDEVHTFKSKSLTGLMGKCRDAEYRIGTTGTLDGTLTHKLVLEGLFGRVCHVTTTKKLMDEGTLSDLDINILILKHPEETCRDVAKFKDNRPEHIKQNSKGSAEYQYEIDKIIEADKRNKFIRNLALDQDGNTLVLFQFVERHGKVIFDLINEKAHKRRKVFFVAGETDTDTREEIRHVVEKEKNAVIVASLGTFSTGINIKNLHNVIFASPSKSQTLVLQSIGRGLRKSDDGSGAKLYDIVDDMCYKGRKNFAIKHGVERLKIYKREKFEYQVHEVKL